MCKTLPNFYIVKNCYPTWVIIYPSITHTYVDIVQRLCKYLPTLCTGKYLHNIYVYG